jgi:transcriptional regulator with XRE-family HTH domain
VAQIPLFGQRVARIRQERGLSVQELATKARTTYQTIWRIETGHMKAPSIVLAQRIARALGVGVDYLIGMFDDDKDTEDSSPRAEASVG